MTFEEQMIEKLQTLLLANPGVEEVVVDGQRVKYANLTAQLDYWQRRVNEAGGMRPRASSIKLDGI